MTPRELEIIASVGEWIRIGRRDVVEFGESIYQVADGSDIDVVTLGTRVNGKRFAKCEPVRWNHGSGCHDWDDAEDRLTHFEVMTRHPDPKRSPIEAELIRTILNPGKEI